MLTEKITIEFKEKTYEGTRYIIEKDGKYYQKVGIPGYVERDNQPYYSLKDPRAVITAHTMLRNLVHRYLKP